jgi:antitoxin component YwqK of YwqJK toxin-antitoxin module
MRLTKVFLLFKKSQQLILTALSYKESYKNLFIIFLSLTITSVFGQKCQTKEIKITYSDGINVFDVCATNPSINFDKNNKYFWYSEISGSLQIKSTEGGCGGNLLNGKERFFDNEGNLLSERSYNLGLLDGESKYWDSTGRLQKMYKHVNGSLVYRKEKVQGGWFEDIGLPLSEGYTRRNYDEVNNLTTESVLKNGNYLTKDFYKYSKKIQYQYSSPWWCDTCFRGKYLSFYENGYKKVEGQYSDSLTNIKVGIWKWYKQNGTPDGQEMYKEEIQRWFNGKWKVTGGYYYDTESKKWLKIGTWDFSDENGKYLYSKVFDFDIEVGQ